MARLHRGNGARGSRSRACTPRPRRHAPGAAMNRLLFEIRFDQTTNPAPSPTISWGVCDWSRLRLARGPTPPRTCHGDRCARRCARGDMASPCRRCRRVTALLVSTSHSGPPTRPPPRPCWSWGQRSCRPHASELHTAPSKATSVPVPIRSSSVCWRWSLLGFLGHRFVAQPRPMP